MSRDSISFHGTVYSFKAFVKSTVINNKFFEGFSFVLVSVTKELSVLGFQEMCIKN